MSDPVGGREAEIEAVWLCPIHAEEFWMPHGGLCPLPGCDRDLVKYVRSSGSAAQNQEEARVTCSWCEGTGWVCDGCGRPEKLCMASACGGAALSMSGCPKCYRGGCGGSGYVLAARSPQDEDREEKS